ncbi:MAG TPA: lipid II flippase MurJ, partial [Rhodothermales bacterium]|nr:lipid II flippase MurJ [Rhodothermales bacterium]
VAIIGGLVLGGLALPDGVQFDALPANLLDRLLFAALIGALVGGGLQFAVQLPTVLKLLKGFRPSFSLNVEGVRASIKAFVPVVLGRGAYQLSGYIDTFLAGFLAAGAVSSFNNALVLYVLPVSLFGMSVAASELPELSRISTSELSGFLERVTGSLRQILYLIVPTVVGYLLFGDLVVGALYQTGAFGHAETWMVALVLMALTLGLVATTATRLLQNAFYALQDTRTPARLATIRLVVSTVVGAGLMLLFERYTLGQVPGLTDTAPTGGGAALRLGAVGLALGASLGAWLEQVQLVRALRRHAPAFHLPTQRTLQMAGLALAAAVPAALLRWLLPDALPVLIRSALILGVYGLGYLALGHRLGFTEGEAWVGRLLRRRKK